VSERPSPIPENYDDFLRDLKERIRSAQVRAALSVNRELVLLYWQLGRDILTRQRQQGWGAKVITKLSKDLRQAFPEMKGFSRTNLLYMRAFAEAYPDEQIVQAVLGQITWYHNIALLDKLKSLKNDCGTRRKPSNTAGAVMFWFTKLKRVYTVAWALHSPTLTEHSPSLNPIWHSSY
jgi:predicted nuclease of restriction endonuclease-like (RecB) superfamily